MIDMIILTELDKLLFHSLPSHYTNTYNLSVHVTFINAEHQTLTYGSFQDSFNYI